MRRYFAPCLFLTAVMITACCVRQKFDESIRVMTFNIRLDSPDDGPNQWIHRKEFAAGMIRFHRADLAGLQEALKGQVDDLAALLPEYGWFGVGRDDGRAAGEHMAVFYRKDRFQVLEQSTFWLSETPENVTKGWDAACFRIVTWGRLKDTRTKKTYICSIRISTISGTSRAGKAPNCSWSASIKRRDPIPWSSPVISIRPPSPSRTG